MSKKYLRKSEFRYNTGPKVVRPDGKGHPTYISARYKNKYRFNVITHSDTFFDEPTHHLTVEPNRNRKKKLKKTSRFSSPRWDNINYFGDKLENWKLGKKDKAKIKKFNKKYK